MRLSGNLFTRAVKRVGHWNRLGGRIRAAKSINIHRGFSRYHSQHHLSLDQLAHRENRLNKMGSRHNIQRRMVGLGGLTALISGGALGANAYARRLKARRAAA